MSQAHTDQRAPISPEELRRRVLYALLLPAVRLSLVFGLSLKEAGELLQMAYYHEARRREMKMQEIGDRLGISMRKVAQLSHQLKVNFAQPEAAHELPRRVEFALWARPLSAARLAQTLRVDLEEIERALQALQEQGRARQELGRTATWRVVRDQGRLVQDAWLARVDGLQNLLGTLANAVYGRFFEDEPGAFARTLSLRLRNQDQGALRALYEEIIWPRLAELDQRAQGDADAHEVDVSILWAPYEYIHKKLATNPNPEGESL